METIKIPVTPVPKPRMTQRDKWQKRDCVMRYRDYCDLLRLHLRKVEIPENNIHITFLLPMPESWSKKKKRELEGKPHQQKPDKDNLEKAFWDALKKDDSGVWNTWTTKIWSSEPGIIIEEFS